jgi:hypothetical protein
MNMKKTLEGVFEDIAKKESEIEKENYEPRQKKEKRPLIKQKQLEFDFRGSIEVGISKIDERKPLGSGRDYFRSQYKNNS